MGFISPELMQGAIAMVGVGLLGKIVWDWVRLRRGNGENGKLATEVHDLGVKVDNLRLEIAGNYAKRTELTELSGEVRDMRDTTVRVGTEVETLKKQMSEAFQRLNARP